MIADRLGDRVGIVQLSSLAVGVDAFGLGMDLQNAEAAVGRQGVEQAAIH